MIIGDPKKCPIALSDGCKTCSKIYSEEDRSDFGNCHDEHIGIKGIQLHMKFEQQRRSHEGKVSGVDPWRDLQYA